VADDAATISRPGRLEELPALVDHVRHACASAGADASTIFAMRLAAEEVCVNLIRYGYAGREPGPIEIGVRIEPRRIVVTIVDFSPSFSPEDAPDPDFVSEAAERRAGGLGWHLVKSVMDEVRYEARGAAGNRLTLIKNFEPMPSKEEVHGDHGDRIGSPDGRRDRGER
jgi:anti-sigma regulatory factor (Ser/Thr protein kinase)